MCHLSKEQPLLLKQTLQKSDIFFYVIIFFAKLKRLLDAANIPLLAKQSNSLSYIMLDYKIGYIPLPHLLKCQNEEHFYNR